jgi:hypothetical protein
MIAKLCTWLALASTGAALIAGCGSAGSSSSSAGSSSGSSVTSTSPAAASGGAKLSPEKKRYLQELEAAERETNIPAAKTRLREHAERLRRGE